MTNREELATRLGKIAANRGLPSEDRADLREAAQLIRESAPPEPARVDPEDVKLVARWITADHIPRPFEPPDCVDEAAFRILDALDPAQSPESPIHAASSSPSVQGEAARVGPDCHKPANTDPRPKETPMPPNEPAPSFTDEDRNRLNEITLGRGPVVGDPPRIARALAYIEELEARADALASRISAAEGGWPKAWTTAQPDQTLPPTQEQDVARVDPDPYGENPLHRHSPAPDVEGGMEPDRFGSWVPFNPAQSPEPEAQVDMTNIFEQPGGSKKLAITREDRDVARVRMALGDYNGPTTLSAGVVAALRRVLDRLQAAQQRIAQLEAEVGDLRGDLEACERVLQRIASMPTVERNPDGVDQAAASMQLVAQAALTRAEGRDAG